MDTTKAHVVDDDDEVRKSVCDMFKASGIPVESYASAEEFLQRYSAGMPGCLIVDLHLPGMSGLELQETLAQRQGRMSLILVSGQLDQETMQESLDLGAVAVLEKPYSMSDLVHRVKTALGLPTQ